MRQEDVITAEDILRLTRARPFRPFRIHMSDGARFEIPHPEFAIVTRRQIVVGVPSSTQVGLSQDYQICSILQVTRLEALADAG